jgi:hypothetical protein
MAKKPEVSKEQAEQVLQVVREHIGFSDPVEGPQLYPAEHEEMPDGCWSIAYEGWTGDTPWTYDVPAEKLPAGVYVEAMYHWCLGVFPA